jgi:tRNA(Ile)-lysidine synthase
MVPAQHLIDRFTRDLDALIPSGGKIGLAVSGGPDSVALLLLAAAARPTKVEAATVDHRLRAEAAAEANMVHGLCVNLRVPHVTLNANWVKKPDSAIQERARAERYRLLADWAHERGLEAIVTGHHADDQAETLLMRLARGSGVRGLAGMRRTSTVPGSDIPLLRPLLGWRREELERVCDEAGVEPASDPSNTDDQFERVRVRNILLNTPDLDATSLASSAAHLGEADAALEWAADQEWERSVSEQDGGILYLPQAPTEIQRRILARVIAMLGSEGDVRNLRGKELDHLIATLAAGDVATIRGIRCGGGAKWRFSKAPPRRP